MRDRRQAAEIVFDHATKRYPGRETPAVDDLSMTIPAGEVCCLVGPSGGGKTTAMKLVNRLVELTSGDVRVDGRSVKSLDETVDELHRRRLAAAGRPDETADVTGRDRQRQVVDRGSWAAGVPLGRMVENDLDRLTRSPHCPKPSRW